MSKEKTKNLMDPFAFMRAIAAVNVFLIHAGVFSSMYGFSIESSTWFLKIPGHGSVWIFFFLSGFFNLSGFLGDSPRYELTLSNIKDFYIKRFIKVLLPVWVFCFFALIFSEPDFVRLYPFAIIRLLTFTFTGNPGCTSIAATWYVSTLAQLYLITPLLAYLLRFFTKKKGILIPLLTLSVISAAGLCLRLILLNTGIDWTQGVFVPFYCNLDLYIAGALCCILCKRLVPFISGIIPYFLSIIVFIILLIIHCRIYYLSISTEIFETIYRYIMPSVYIIVLTVICALIDFAGFTYSPASLKALPGNPLRLIDMFSSISFEFYLVHSMVLFHIAPYIKAGTPLSYHFSLIAAGFIVSVIIAFLFKKIISSLLLTPLSRLIHR